MEISIIASGILSSTTTEALETDAKENPLSLMEQLPTEVLHQIFSFLSLRDLSPVALASSRLQKVSRTAPLWKTMSFKLKLVDESFAAPDLDYKAIVSAAFDRTFIDSLINRHFLTTFDLLRLCRLGYDNALLKAAEGMLRSYKSCEDEEELKESMKTTTKELNDLLITQGNREAVERKITGLASGENGYEKNPAAARKLNEDLIAQGDREAISRKIEGLSNGRYGYEENQAAARELNESLVAQEDREAISRKIEGLASGENGYEANSAAARELNESLVAQEDREAISRKIEGLAFEQYGYEENPAAAKKLNDSLIAQGDGEAIDRKILGLGLGYYGYKRDLPARTKFNNALAMLGNSVAVARKIRRLFDGRYGYESDPVAARELNDSLVVQVNSKAIQRKIKWHASTAKKASWKNYIDSLNGFRIY